MKKNLLTKLCLQAGLLGAVAPASPALAAGTPGTTWPQAATQPLRVQATITGTVTDKLTGAPLEIVTVVNK